MDTYTTQNDPVKPSDEYRRIDQGFNILLPIFKIRKKAEELKKWQEVQQIQTMLRRDENTRYTIKQVCYFLAPELYVEAVLDGDRHCFDTFEYSRREYINKNGSASVILAAVESGRVSCDCIIGLFEELINEASAISKLYHARVEDTLACSLRESVTRVGLLSYNIS